MSALRTLVTPARVALRRSAPRRFQSTTSSTSASSTSSTSASDVAAKARQTATDVTSKASQGLSRVASATGPVLAGMARQLTGTLGKVGGRTGRLVAAVERQTPFVVYYARVGLELSKLVFHSQKMTPPPLATFQTAFLTAWARLQNPARLLQQGIAFARQARQLSPTQLASGSVLVAELLGFFTVGEMIGRFKLVGYHGGSPAAARH